MPIVIEETFLEIVLFSLIYFLRFQAYAACCIIFPNFNDFFGVGHNNELYICQLFFFPTMVETQKLCGRREKMDSVGRDQGSAFLFLLMVLGRSVLKIQRRTCTNSTV